MVENLDYIDLKYRPSKNDVIVEFFIEPNKITLEKACQHVAAESSIGTWTTISTMTPEIARKLKPHVFSINKNSGEVKIAYPQDLFEQGNMSNIFSSIGGNIFGMSSVNNIRLQDMQLTKKLIKSFQGPRFGVNGVRKITRIKKRPLVGTIVKPKVGLSPEQHAKVAYAAWMGGCDVVKDDENLASMTFNKFEDRIRTTLDLRDKAEKETGEKKIYMPNISAETATMVKRAEFVKAYGGEYIMVDILTVGWSALQSIRDMEHEMVIHAHRAGHAAFTRNPKHGISMLTIAKAARLCGVDQLHIGAIVGKMEGSAEEVVSMGEEIEQQLVHPKKSAHMLEQEWYNVKPVLAVCSGGLHPGRVDKLMKYMGNNIVIQMGGGIHGHPDGTVAGAAAARQSVEAIMKRKSLRDYAKTHIELYKALAKWGN
ncbi:MAG: type III ribulose-bisphosphate carboxylase [Nanoarchaeota archaeon]|nr:type III ribulose-bisphosphate carboxylase [Nanoarchaeota archaeon]